MELVERTEGLDVQIAVTGRMGSFCWHLLDDEDSITVTVDGFEVLRANRGGVTWVRPGLERASPRPDGD